MTKKEKKARKRRFKSPFWPDMPDKNDYRGKNKKVKRNEFLDT